MFNVIIEWFLYDYYTREQMDDEVINIINRLLKIDMAYKQKTTQNHFVKDKVKNS